jgi:small subunit ribosomal protein S4
MYFVGENQFRNYYEVASNAPGVTGEILLQQLERRLDTIVFRLGFANARRMARQLVRHGHIAVNGKKVNIPSYQVRVGDEISVREDAKQLDMVKNALEFAGHQSAPTWLQIDREAMKGTVSALPKREDINLPINEQLIVELYSK